MAKKLFSKPSVALESGRVYPTREVYVDDTTDLDDDHAALENCVDGYMSVGRVYDSVAAESLSFVDSKNHVLYNEYMKTLSDKLGVMCPVIKTVSTEDFNTRSVIAINSEIALEGWMGDMWKKIKGFFTRIYEKVKGFFKRYFTRLGRAKGGLENILATLKSTDKDLKTAILDKYTGSVLDKFKGTNDLNSAYVHTVVNNVVAATASMSSVNKAANFMATAGIAPAGFIDSIKNLKERASQATASKADVDKATPGIGKAAISKLPIVGDKGKTAADRKEMKETSGTLAETAKDSKKEADDGEARVALAGTDDKGSDEANAAAGADHFKRFSESVVGELKKHVKKQLISGKTFTKVDVNGEGELEIEMDTGEKDDKAENVILSDKTQLSAVANSCLDMIVKMEKDAAAYGKINDTIYANLNTIDKLIAEIDRVDPAKYGAYKKVIDQQIRTRLKLMQKFFSSYNKIGKNIFDIGLETCEGVTAYAVLSLKYFG